MLIYFSGMFMTILYAYIGNKFVKSTYNKLDVEVAIFVSFTSWFGFILVVAGFIGIYIHENSIKFTFLDNLNKFFKSEK